MIKKIKLVITEAEKSPSTQEKKNVFIGQILDVLERSAGIDDS